MTRQLETDHVGQRHGVTDEVRSAARHGRAPVDARTERSAVGDGRAAAPPDGSVTA